MTNEIMFEKLRKDIEKAFMVEVKDISKKIAESVCGGSPFGAVEFSTRRAMLGLGAKALEIAVKHYGGGYEGSAARCNCGKLVKFEGYRASYLDTIMGSFRVKKAYYYCSSCRSGFYPLDEKLDMKKGRTAALRRVISRSGVVMPFEPAAELLEEIGGIRVSDQTVERVTESEGAKVEEREKAQDEVLTGHVWPKKKPERMYASVDGTTAPMRGKGKREYREFKVGAIYTQGSQEKRYYTGIEEAKNFMLDLRRQAIEKGLANADEVIALGDGAPWIWIHFEKNFPMAIQVLDFWHLMEHVHKCAEALFGEGSRSAGSWAKKAKKKLYKKGGIALLYQLRRLRKRRKKEKDIEAIDKLIKYLEDNRGRTDYPTYIEQDIDIGSGPVEAACKTLIGQRLKLSGMAWTEDGAESVAKLRGVFLSGLWNAYWGFGLDGMESTKDERKAA